MIHFSDIQVGDILIYTIHYPGQFGLNFVTYVGKAPSARHPAGRAMESINFITNEGIYAEDVLIRDIMRPKNFSHCLRNGEIKEINYSGG